MKKLILFLAVLFFNPFNLFSQEIEPPDVFPADQILRQDYDAIRHIITKYVFTCLLKK